MVSWKAVTQRDRKEGGRGGGGRRGCERVGGSV